MTLKTFLQGNSFQRIVLLVWLVSSALVIFCSRSIDSIVHGTLYGYGLTFSNNWARPYWMYQDILYDSQFVSIGLGVVALIFGFLNKGNSDRRTAFKNIQPMSAQVSNRDERIPKPEKNTYKPASKPERVGDKPAPRREQNVNMGSSARGKTKGHATGISCPNCRRVLSKALVMLDFSDGNATLVNVCPYCNGILGKAEEQDESQIVSDQHREIVQ